MIDNGQNLVNVVCEQPPTQEHFGLWNLRRIRIALFRDESSWNLFPKWYLVLLIKGKEFYRSSSGNVWPSLKQWPSTQAEPNITVWSIKFFNQRIILALVGMDKAKWFSLWRFLKNLIKMCFHIFLFLNQLKKTSEERSKPKTKRNVIYLMEK